MLLVRAVARGRLTSEMMSVGRRRRLQAEAARKGSNELVAVFSAIKVFNWTWTLKQGAIAFKTSLLRVRVPLPPVSYAPRCRSGD